jgi:phospholipid-transporting ATPase
MSWQKNEVSLLDLDDPAPSSSSRQTRPYTAQSDPFAERPSTSYDDFAGQGSNYPLGQPPSNLSMGTTGTSSGQYAPQSFFDDAYNDDDHVLIDRHTQRSRRSNRDSGSGLGTFLGRVTGGRLGAKADTHDMDLPLTQTGMPPAGSQPPPLTTPITDTAPTADAGSTHSRESSRWKLPSFHFGRAPVDPSTLGPRIIHLNDAPANAAQKFLDNHVSTAKYNIATFFPKFLFEQFSKYANLFFLFTAIIQQVPDVSPTNQYTTVGPLAVVLLVSAIKEAIEDIKRHNQDRDLNRSKAEVLQGGEFISKKWYQIRVGDIIRVTSGSPIPADLILFASSEPEGLCYIETANLDGETNLKIKQALPETAGILSPGVLSRVQGTLKSEQPNNSLYTFEGTLTIDTGGGEKEIPLSPEQMLLRVYSTIYNQSNFRVQRYGIRLGYMESSSLPAMRPNLCAMQLLLLSNARP